MKYTGERYIAPGAWREGEKLGEKGRLLEVPGICLILTFTCRNGHVPAEGRVGGSGLLCH